MSVISAEQYDVLVHCLGFDMKPCNKKKPHRNYYCVEPGQDGFEMVNQLVNLGYMEREEGQCFRATSLGIAVARVSYEDYVLLAMIEPAITI